MEIVYACGCGLDVHAKTVVACLITPDQKERRTCSTMPDDVLRLSDWLVNAGGTHVAIASTGVDWKPVFTILEGLMEVIVVHARHSKAVPGHTTDARDRAWLADLLRHGLRAASVIPPRPSRDLRALTRSRSRVLRDQSAVANRIQKVIERGNSKLGHVVNCAGRQWPRHGAGLSGGRDQCHDHGGLRTPEREAEKAGVGPRARWPPDGHATVGARGVTSAV